MTQVFGNIVETFLKNERKDLNFLALKNVFKEYCRVTNEHDLDLLCRYVMDSSKSTAKVSPIQAIKRFNTLIDGVTIYTDNDFEKVIKTIDDHPTEKHKNELFTILKMFASKNGAAPEMLLNVISGSKINFDKKAFLIYLMKKSQSITKISGSVLHQFCVKRSNSLEKSLVRDKSTASLKIAHLEFGDDEHMDKNSLGYKLR